MKKHSKPSSEESIAKSLTAIFLHLFATINRMRFDDSNPNQVEDLHDYRVAIRQTRCLLGQFKQVFHKPAIQHFRDEFSWLFTETGKVRDLDVQIANLELYKNQLPDSFSNNLLLLNNQLLAQQYLAYSDLSNTFTTARYQQLLNDWPAYLKDKHSIKSHYADDKISAFANQRIQINHLAILKLTNSIDINSTDETFHDLRKNCKKLRYLLDFFGLSFNTKATEKLISLLKKFQNDLGLHQDLCVQIRFIQALSTLKPSKWKVLIDLLEIEKHHQRVELIQQFGHFSQISIAH